MIRANRKCYFLVFSSYYFVKFFVRSNFGVYCSERDNVNHGDLYSDKLILAPMVQQNTLPFRLLALDYGADIVYSEEIVDHALLRSVRHHNDILNTVDYVDRVDGSVIFRTCPREKHRIILQIGASDPEKAARAAMFVAKDVAGIDINMGCPKRFTTSGSMGADLLCDPDTARKVIESVRRAVNIPVSCKIRALRNAEDTISFCKRMVEGGVMAIAVHGLTADQRPCEPNQIDIIKSVSKSLPIPVIANGDSNNVMIYDDLLTFKRKSGCTSVMIARAAQDNPSIFRKDGKLPVGDVIKAFLRYAVLYNNCLSNTKYCIQKMLGSRLATPQGKTFSNANSLEEICKIWEMDDFYRETMNDYKAKSEQFDVTSQNEGEKVNECHSLRYKFVRTNFVNEDDLPKSVLLRYSQKSLLLRPTYDTWEEKKFFRSIVTFNNTKYTSSYWEKDKQAAEQGAAAVCLNYLKPHLKNKFHEQRIVPAT